MKNSENKYFPGTHLLIDYWGCPAHLLNDAVFLQDKLVETARIMQATIVSVHFNQFNPIGVSGVIVIAESHITIHTWPELGYVAIDIFTCGDMDTHAGIDHLRSTLLAEKSRVRVLKRGR